MTTKIHEWEYPENAINSVEVLKTLVGQTIYSASRKFHLVVNLGVFVTTGVEHARGVGFSDYHYFRVKKQPNSEALTGYDKSGQALQSLRDNHLGVEWQDYNDWFLFTDKKAASLYANINNS